MKRQSKFHKMGCLLLIVLQLISVIPMGISFAADVGIDDIPTPFEPEKRLLLTNKDLFLDGVFKDPQFIKGWAEIANYLGIGWCGGTASNVVGGDFTVEKVTTLEEAAKYQNDFDGFQNVPFYVIKANYNKDDPYASGYRANERLKMFISDADILFDPDTLEFGPALHSKLEPLAVVSKIIRNNSLSEITSPVAVEYSDATSTSLTHSANVGIKLGVKHATVVKASPVGVGADVSNEVNFEISAGYNFSKTTVNSNIIVKKSEERISVPSKRKVAATVYALKNEATFPYQGDVQAVYNITLSGFYRYKDNSEWGHAETRPNARVKFGSYTTKGENTEGLIATDDIMKQYINRSIKGDSKTDWQWIMDKYGADRVKNAIGNVAKKTYVSRINGRFSHIDSCIFYDDVRDLGPLGPGDSGLGESTYKSVDPLHKYDPLTPPDTTSRVNLALNKPVKASGYLRNESPEKAVNGTISSIDDCWTSNDGDLSQPRWIVVDLGAVRKIDYVSIAHAGVFGYSDAVNNRNFNISVSDDGQRFTTVEGKSWNYEDRTNIPLNDREVLGRYIKLEVTIPGFNNYESAAKVYDFAVYGFDTNPVKYNITYAGNGNTGGNPPTDQNSHYRFDKVHILGNEGNLEKKGYEFDGWNTRADGFGDNIATNSDIEMLGKNLTLYARWKKTDDIAYKKDVKANHAISYHPASNAVNGTMNDLDDKWCTNQGTGAQWLEVDLGAQYSINKWVVKHAGAFGEDSGYNTREFKLQKKVGSSWVDVDNVYDNTDSTTERNVNPFSSRFVRLYITNPTNNGDGAARIFQFKLYGVVEEENKFHVKYEGNGNIGGTAPVDANEYDDNAIIYVLGNTGELTKPGYRFDSWNTMPDGSGSRYNVGANYTINSNDITLYAQWIKDNSTENLTYKKPAFASNNVSRQTPDKAVNGTINNEDDKWCSTSNPQWLYVDLGATYEISRWVVKHAEAGGESSDYNTKDFTLEISNSDPSDGDFGTADRVTGNLAAYTDREFEPVKARYVRLRITKPTNLPYDNAARIYGFEVYGVPCYTVNYNGAGNTGGSVPGDTSYARNAYSEGSLVTIEHNTKGLEKSGYTLIGWNTEPDGTGVTYQAGDTFTMGKENINLYAIWRDSSLSNVSLGKKAMQSSTLSGADASRAVDGNTDGNFVSGSVTLTAESNNPWWQVDLGGNYNIDHIKVYNRTDNYSDRLNNYDISILNNSNQVVWSSNNNSYPDSVSVVDTDGQVGRYVKINLNNRNFLSLAEVEVFGAESTVVETPTYSIQYDGNGYESGNVPEDFTSYEENQGVIILGNQGTLTKNGYEFNGWNTSSDGRGTAYLAGETLNMGSSDVVLYAQWTAKPVPSSNIALNKTATQSSNYDYATADRAVDGNTSGEFGHGSVTHTQNDYRSWWMVDLGENYKIGDIEIWNRAECKERLDNFDVIVLDENMSQVWINSNTAMPNPSITLNANGIVGRYVKVQLTNAEFLSLAEVKVYGYPAPVGQ